MEKDPQRKTYTLLLIIVFLSLFIVWIRTVTVEETYRYVAKEKKLLTIKDEAQSLRLQWLQMIAPQKLESLALSSHLLAPKEDQVFFIKKSKK